MSPFHNLLKTQQKSRIVHDEKVPVPGRSRVSTKFRIKMTFPSNRNWCASSLIARANVKGFKISLRRVLGGLFFLKRQCQDPER